MSGGSCHSFGESVDFHACPMHVAFRQGFSSAALDALVAAGDMPVPRRVKIDVHGIEHKVPAGAPGTLRDRRLASLLVWLNTALDEHWGLVDRMQEPGFDYSSAQADAVRREGGAFEGAGNYVFRR